MYGGLVISDDDYGKRDFRFSMRLYIVTAIDYLTMFSFCFRCFFLLRFFFVSFLTPLSHNSTITFQLSMTFFLSSPFDLHFILSDRFQIEIHSNQTRLRNSYANIHNVHTVHTMYNTHLSYNK